MQQPDRLFDNGTVVSPRSKGIDAANETERWLQSVEVPRLRSRYKRMFASDRDKLRRLADPKGGSQ
jgi:hypothetical protein